MGLIDTLFSAIFGNGRNAIAETAQVWRENAEGSAVREAELTEQVLTQYGGEFGLDNRGRFDRVMDGINRIPRPALAMGTLLLFVAAMTDPIWFAERMQGIALVPEPLWWLLGAIVSFYFGARHQVKSQQFQRSIATTMAIAPQVAQNIGSLRKLDHDGPGQADTGRDAVLTLSSTQDRGEENAALSDWSESRQR